MPTSTGTRTTNAAVYCRISKDRDGTALGVERQEKDCRKLAKQHGWNVTAVYTDNDISAFSGKRRPGYEQLLEAVRSGAVTAIVAFHPDRLHRSTKELDEFIDIVREHGTEIATVLTGNYDLTTPSGRMTARVVGAVARHESEHKSDRIRTQRAHAAARGEPAGGARSYGYTTDMTIVPAEAKVIRDAVKRVLAGESVHSIAKRWNANGVATVKGGAWTRASVQQVLEAPRIAGLRVHRGEVVATATWDPIISREQHERLVALFAARRTGRGRPPTSLLGGGLLRCGECGATMQSAGPAYVCHVTPGHGGCGAVSVKKADLEAHVVATFLEQDHPGIVRSRARQHATEDNAAAASIGALEGRLVALAELFADGSVTQAEYLAARARIADQLTEARSSLVTTEAARVLAPYYAEGMLRVKWPKLDREEQRRILGAVLDHATVHRPPKRGPKFDPGRVSFTWIGEDDELADAA